MESNWESDRQKNRLMHQSAIKMFVAVRPSNCGIGLMPATVQINLEKHERNPGGSISTRTR
jgi:hypothetical protein